MITAAQGWSVNSLGNGVYQTGTVDTTLKTAAPSSSAPTPTTSSPAATPVSTPQTAAQPLPTDTTNSSQYLTSLKQGLQTAQSAASPNYNYINSLQQAISTETTRQSGITSQAQKLVSGGAGSTDINNYYSSLHPNDQHLVGDALGVTASNVNTYGLTPASGQSWYQLQKGETTANYNARIASVNPNLPAPGTTSSTGVTNSAANAPAMTQIGTTITPPTISGTPTLPQGTAGHALSTYTTGVAATLDAQNAQLAAANQQRVASYQQQIDTANQAAADAKNTAEMGLSMEGSAVNSEAKDKAAALQTEQQQYTDNYNAIQGLASQAAALVATSAALTTQMQNTTGLASIMNPRISQTAANTTAQLAVIKGAVDIYSGAIGSAQNQLKSATDAISSIYGDQISYYNNIVSFYEGQQTKSLSQAASLTTEQKTYIDAQIKQLSDQVANTQATADYISKAMIDPTTALAFGKAGVSLTDTIPQINAKMATYEQSQQLQWGPAHTDNQGSLVQTNKITGEIRMVDNAPSSSAGANPATNPVNIGSGLSLASQAIANGNDPAKVRQGFLSDHPGAVADWNSYFGDSTTGTPSGSSAGPDLTYPTPPDPAKSGLFGWGIGPF